MKPRLPASRIAGGSPAARPAVRRAAWGLLLLLLGGLLLGTATFDRTRWPTLMGDEATYLMQAESLAFDLDLTYSVRDFERFVRHWDQAPEGVILQRGTDGGALVYGKPFFYAAWASPFVRISPTRGPFVANALLLALAAAASAWALRRPLGWAAPVWVAVFVFASVTFAHVFWAHLDLFLACCAALGLAAVFGPGNGTSGETTGAGRRATLQAALPWAAAGLLLGTVTFSRPLYLPLFLPAVLAAVSRRRAGPRPAVALTGLAAGALVLVLAAAAVQASLAGSWTSYGGERRSFNSVVGFPGVDLPEGSWEEMIREWGNASWLKPRDLTGVSVGNLHLWGWNGLYLLAGRSVGLFPYFVPALLGFLARPRGPARWALLGVVLLTAAGFLLVRPFNFYGGGGALANRYLLPVYPALWFLPARRASPAWPLLVAALAAPFLWPLWSAPRSYPVTEDGTFRYVSRAARATLPFETTQNHLKPGGPQPEAIHNGLWVKPLDPAVSIQAGGEVLHLDGEGPGVLLLGRSYPLGVIEVEIEAAALPLDVEGGRIAGRAPGPAGWHLLRIELDGPRAVHPMWWTEEDFHLYRLSLDPREDLDRTFAFRITPRDD